MWKKACLPKEELRRGAWTEQEDKLLSDYIESHGLGRWRSLPAKAGLNRCGKSCRLRWLNYLRPGIKRGNITYEEEDLIIRLHKLLGNRWSLIAGRIPGRTDNEIKNYWNTYLKKKISIDVSKSQSSSKTITATTTTTITTTMHLSIKNPGNENANKRKNEEKVTSMVKSKIIKCANDLPTYETEDLNKNNSFSHEEHLTMKLEGHEQVCLPASASASSDFGFGLELSFGELSNSSVFSDYEWKDVKSIASPSVIGDVFNSKRMERKEEMHPFIAEVEWESLIKSCEAI
ncbi:hypothetical protein M5K25_009843 [Dendrobium thyrsiflorum]|uniref:Uncharacterized protein n=1 Tax=Dendrobium thyrsiflorum TaxID=117978 RepID=A0ABD0VDX7_DENTH